LGDEFFKTGKYAGAEKQYDAALNVFPNYHFALAGKGRARTAQNDFESAVKFLTESNNRVPNVEDVIYLGDVYSKTGKQDEANKQYELAQFIEQQPGNNDQRRLALLWADRDTKLDEALSVAAREHETRKDIFTADIYAWCLYKKGQFQEAKSAIAEAMRLKTKDARIFYHAGMIEKSLGNKKAAADYLRKALQTNPAFDILQAEKAKTALQEIS
jgi:tetratricopeptide (TPR) repeat protein